MSAENDLTPASASEKSAAARGRGPRRFVLICTIAIAAVIAYPMLFGRDGFLKTFPKMLSATPTPSASESPNTSPSP